MARNRAVFLDRDGVLNKVVIREGVVSSPWTLNEFEIIPGSRRFVEVLKARGYEVYVVTNQPDVDRGHLAEAELQLMNERLVRELGVDGVDACVSSDDSDNRRKPNPGMILERCEVRGLDPSDCYLIGDGIKDMLAGRAASVATILLKTKYNREAESEADFVCGTYEEILEKCIPENPMG